MLYKKFKTCYVTKVVYTTVKVMIEFFLPSSRALLPTFHINCPDGISFCPVGVSFCPEFQNQPLFFTQPSQTPFGDIYLY